VKLIPPQYVKPFVKQGKNDRNDAEAICEAASRPNMTFVPVKSATQQAELIILRTRELLVSQRTQLVNALRGHVAEFDVIAAKGIINVGKRREIIAGDTAMPQTARATLAMLGEEIDRLDVRLGTVDASLNARHKANPLSKALAEISGIGPITALTLVTEIEPGRFQSGRHLAAWLGLTPKASLNNYSAILMTLG
jgi:transposase